MTLLSTAPLTDTELIRAYLIEVGHWRPEFAPIVAELVEFRRMRADAVARAQESPLVHGSMGQDRENPALTTAIKLQDQCNRLAKVLLLTPAAAEAAGVRWDGDPLDGFLGD